MSGMQAVSYAAVCAAGDVLSPGRFLAATEQWCQSRQPPLSTFEPGHKAIKLTPLGVVPHFETHEAR